MIQDSNERGLAIVGIGSSAGGPAALERPFAGLPCDLPAAFLVSQRMPKRVTRPLAERFSLVSKCSVTEAHHGRVAKVGEALVAPGGHNMEISRDGTARVERAPDRAASTPSINAMMKSVARAYGHRSVGVLLTRMLSDGVKGIKTIKENDGVTIAQDEASSLVYGMLKAALDAEWWMSSPTFSRSLVIE